MLYRSISGVAFRVLDEKKRLAVFTAVTQSGVKTPYGVEHLVMKGANLRRFNKNPILLDSHRREESEFLIGKCQRLRMAKGRMQAEVQFHGITKRSQDVWEMVRQGYLRSMSIGYDFGPNDVVELAEGQEYKRDGIWVRGPALVVPRWDLLELSVLPLGADEDALRREFYTGLLGRGRGKMGIRKGKKAEPDAEEEVLDEEAEEAEGEADDAEDSDEEEDEASEKAEDGAEEPEGEDDAEADAEEADGDAEDEDEPEEPEEPGRKKKSRAKVCTGCGRSLPKPKPFRSQEARELAALKEKVMAIAPTGLRAFAETLVLRGLDFDRCRRILLKKSARSARPLASPEPTRATAPKKRGAADNVDDDSLVRAFGG